MKDCIQSEKVFEEKAYLATESSASFQILIDRLGTYDILERIESMVFTTTI